MINPRQRHHANGASGQSAGAPRGGTARRLSARKIIILFFILLLAFQVIFFSVSRQTVEEAVASPEEKQEMYAKDELAQMTRNTRRDTGGGSLVDGLDIFKNVKKSVLARASTNTPQLTTETTVAGDMAPVEKSAGKAAHSPFLSEEARLQQDERGTEKERFSETSSSIDTSATGNASHPRVSVEEENLHDPFLAARADEKEETPERGGEDEKAKEDLLARQQLDEEQAEKEQEKQEEEHEVFEEVVESGSARTVKGQGLVTADPAIVPRRVAEEARTNGDPLRNVRVPIPLISHRPFIRRATPQPPTPCPPPLLMPGKESLVSTYGVFTVVTVVWNARALKPLEELARSLYHTGLCNHTRFFEFLVYVGGNSGLEIGEVRGKISDWWQDAAAKEQLALSDQAPLDAMLQKVRVVKQPLRTVSWNRPPGGNASPAPVTIVEAMRLVRSEYVVFNPVEDPVYLFPQLWKSTTGDDAIQGAAAASTGERLLPVKEHVRTVLNIALQTMSNNKVVQDNEPDAPLVIDQADFLRSDDVHAFRLRLYPSTSYMPQDAALAKKMDLRITQFLKMVVQDIEHSFRTPGLSGAAAEGSEVKAESATMQQLLQEFPDPYANLPVVAGLPRARYGTDTHYHCQRAPIYGVEIYVPGFFRKRVSSKMAGASEGGNVDNADTEYKMQALMPARRPMTTLCEALLTSPIRMKDLRAQDTFFAHNLCKAWAELTGSRQLQQQSPLPSLFAQSQVSLCDSACSFDWLTVLKNEQLFATSATRRWNPLFRDSANITSTTARSPLHTFARMVFTTNETEALGYADRFFPFAANVSASLESLRFAIHSIISPEEVSLNDAIAAHLSPGHGGSRITAADSKQQQRRLQSGGRGRQRETVSMKYVVQGQRHRANKKKRDGDAEVLCFSSSVCAFTLEPTMYRTDWVVGNVLSRCLRHPAECGNIFGSSVAAVEEMKTDPDGVSRRTMRKMAHYLSSTGRWGRGEYKVCMTGGISLHDPESLLFHDETDPLAA